MTAFVCSACGRPANTIPWAASCCRCLAFSRLSANISCSTVPALKWWIWTAAASTRCWCSRRRPPTGVRWNYETALLRSATRNGAIMSLVLRLVFAWGMLVIGAVTRADDAATIGRVFLSFDDGPSDVTSAILDVLKAEQVKATFFVNAIHLLGQGGEREDHARAALRRIIAEGHVLGNHSYDHMMHIRPPVVYALGAAQSYRDVDIDLPYFLDMNVAPIAAALGELAGQSNNRITQLARLPFANVWRFPQLDRACAWWKAGPRAFWHPDARAHADREVSEAGGRLAEALHRRHHINSFGWDLQWMPTDWTSAVSNETLPSEQGIVEQIAAQLDAGRYCLPPPQGDYCNAPVREGRVVVMKHDFLFEAGPRGRGAQLNMPRLVRLIIELKTRGYRCETLDRYLD